MSASDHIITPGRFKVVFDTRRNESDDSPSFRGTYHAVFMITDY